MNRPVQHAPDRWSTHSGGAEPRSPILSRVDWFLIIIAAVAGIASATYLVTDGFRRASELSEAQRWESHTLQVIATAEQTRSAIRNMQRGQSGYLLTLDDTYLQPYLQGRQQAQSHLAQLRTLTRDNPEQAATLTRLQEVVRALDARLAALIADQRGGRAQAAIAVVRAGGGERLIGAADAEIDRMMQVETRLLTKRRKTLRDAAAAAWENQLALSALGLASLCAVLWLLFRGLAASRVIEFERDRATLAEQLVRRDAQLAEQVAEFNALYSSAPIGLAFFSRDHRFLRINEELSRILGRPAAKQIGRRISEILPTSASTIEQMVDRTFSTGSPIRNFEIEAASPLEPDVPRYWLTGFFPVKNEQGEVEAVGAWVVEISERKRAEEREALLAREVDHRAKNLLAVVQSVVQLTQASDAEMLKTAIIGRIQALARAHSLLADSRWDGAELDRLVREELAPYLSGSDARASVDGPSLLLRPAAAQSLGIVLHELATNAVKYGALSTSEGRLSVQWQRSGDSLEIRWTECGGPRAQIPSSSGFGSKIIRTSIERQLHGSLDQDWRPEGLQCTINISAREALGPSEPKGRD